MSSKAALCVALFACLYIQTVFADAPINMTQSYYGNMIGVEATDEGEEVEECTGSYWYHPNNASGKIACLAGTGLFSGGTVEDMDQKLIMFVADGYCDCYCELATDEEFCNDFGSFCQYDWVSGNAKKNGTDVIDGKKVDRYDWTEPLGIFTMATNTLYNLIETAVPAYKWSVLSPFDIVVGNMSLEWDTYTAKDPDPSVFHVNNEQYCDTCADEVCDEYLTMRQQGRWTPLIRKALMKKHKTTHLGRV
jgi:hypothetical protein